MEAISPVALLIKGKEVDLCIFIDSNYICNRQPKRTKTGFLTSMNMSSINLYSKKLSTMEISVFGAEIVAMKVGVETLRMMGIPISGPS